MSKNKLLLLLALLLTAATGAWAQTTYTIKFEANGNTKTVENVTLPHTFLCDYSGENGELDQIIKQLYGLSGGCCSLLSPGASGNSNVTAGMNGDNQFITISAPFEGNATVTGYYFDAAYSDFDYSLTISCPGYTPAGYTVSLKDGVKDADKWTVKVGEGQAQALPIGGLKGDGSETVTLQYNGRLKVKGVKATSEAAPAAKPAATVTTAPTGAAIVGVGKTTALVSGGVADGGTLMYAVTTTDTKPASTDGFSATVPTAQTITASGKVYVWYYVKGDDTHSDSEIAATAIEVTVAQVITWNSSNVSDLMLYGTDEYAKEGITLIGNGYQVAAVCYNFGDPEMDGISFQTMESGGFTFTAPNGKAFTKIEMKANGPAGWDFANLGTGWAFNVDWEKNMFTATWNGSAAASTVGLLTDESNFHGESISYIAFYLVDAE